MNYQDQPEFKWKYILYSCFSKKKVREQIYADSSNKTTFIYTSYSGTEEVITSLTSTKYISFF